MKTLETELQTPSRWGFDTATLGGLVYGQTVLAKIAETAGLSWDSQRTHSALYDAEQTAELFCMIINRWKKLPALELS